MVAGRAYRSSFLGVCLILMAAFALAPSVTWASGGGGCGKAVTDASGRTVDIEGFCFTPTILRVTPGSDVTFANLDPVPHTVLGANGSWGGYDFLKVGHEATYRFSRPGVYPFVCTVHPGMVGVVVVGNGVGGAIRNTTAAGPVTQVFSPSPAALAAVATATGVEAYRAARMTVALAAMVLVVLTLVTLVVARRRRRSVA